MPKSQLWTQFPVGLPGTVALMKRETRHSQIKWNISKEDRQIHGWRTR